MKIVQLRRHKETLQDVAERLLLLRRIIRGEKSMRDALNVYDFPIAIQFCVETKEFIAPQNELESSEQISSSESQSELTCLENLMYANKRCKLLSLPPQTSYFRIFSFTLFLSCIPPCVAHGWSILL